MTQKLRIGVSGPFSGPRAAYGELLRDSAEASSINADLIFADDVAQVDQAVRVAETFVAQGVDAVVGHFNSDCARVAGPIYRNAGIPFVMPAATAPDLIDATDGYRICASDDAQIATLAQWLSETGQNLAEVWQDGSSYAARLADLIHSQGLVDADSTTLDTPIAILGAHHAVACEINRRGAITAPIFVPDDCAIDEFDTLIAGSEATTACAVASPGYHICVAQAFQILSRAANTSLSLGAALAQDPIFVKKQHRLARFEIVKTVRDRRHLKGDQS